MLVLVHVFSNKKLTKPVAEVDAGEEELLPLRVEDCGARSADEVCLAELWK